MEIHSSSLHKFTKLISSMLKDLHYELNDWTRDHMKEFLTTPNPSRNELLFWILENYFSQEYPLFEQQAFDQSLKTKILNDFSNIGICRTQDLPLIEGTASMEEQLMFWKCLLETCLKMKFSKNSELKRDTGNLLFTIVNSPFFLPSMEGKECDILPNDLKKQYREWGKDILDVDETLAALHQQKIQIKENLSAKQKTTKIDLQPSTELIDSIMALTAQNESFISVHGESLQPWYKTTDDEFQLDHEIGKLTAHCNRQLSVLEKYISLSSKSHSDCTQVMEEVERLKQTLNPTSATSILEMVSASQT